MNANTTAPHRLDLFDFLEAGCLSDAVAVERPNGRPAWLYGENAALARDAWKRGDLAEHQFITHKRDDLEATYPVVGPTRLGVVLHRDRVVYIFCVDSDAHDGETADQVYAEADAVAELLGAQPYRWTSRSGRGLHDYYMLREPLPVADFVAWAKSHGFNTPGRPEIFPKSAGLSQVWLPSEEGADS